MPFHQDAANGRYFFRKIPDSEVDKGLTDCAEHVRAFVCPDLKIQPPMIVWLCPAAPASKRGPLRRNWTVVPLPIDVSAGFGFRPKNVRLYEIRIPSNLTAHPNLEYVVAHELRHATQKKFYPSVYWDDARAEGDAYPYGYHIRRYLESMGHHSEDLRRDIESKEAATRESYRKNYPNGRCAMIPLGPAT
jgi:hypothetical protein